MPRLAMRLLLAAVVFAALAVTGCRDALVMDLPPLAPPPTGHEAAALYIKGTSPLLRIGDTFTLRVQAHAQAADYVWGFMGEGEVERVGSTFERDLIIRARSVGPIRVEAYAYGPDGVLLGMGRQQFEVVR